MPTLNRKFDEANEFVFPEDICFSLSFAEGIPPHVDTHSAFEDGIVSLSLGSQVFIIVKTNFKMNLFKCRN